MAEEKRIGRIPQSTVRDDYAYQGGDTEDVGEEIE
jgi:hypothetical protein